MVSKVLAKLIRCGIFHPFKFNSKKTLITEPQVVVDAATAAAAVVDDDDGDTRNPVEEPSRGGQEVDAKSNHDLRRSMEDPIRNDEEFVDVDDMLLESRKEVMKKVLLALKHPDVNRIGVLGRGGVGKTMLLKKVALQVTQEKLFDVVVFATVSWVQDMRRTQGEIASGLGFKFNDADTPTERADMLCQQLREKEKVLLILNNIWMSRSQLEELGIPHKNEHKGLKILMASPYDDDMSNKLHPQQIFNLELLGEGESWSLFEKTLGHEITDPTLQSIAKAVANKCVGRPNVLVVVATALKGADLYAWRDALQDLTRFDNDDPEERAFSALELSYNLLRGEEIKSLFLLCGFFNPNFISINDLVEYTWGMGMFKQCRDLEDVSNRLYKLLDDLKASHLLLEGDNNSEVRMHWIVRHFALSIACRHHHILTSLFLSNRIMSWGFENTPNLRPALCFHDNVMFPRFVEFLDPVGLLFVSPNPLLKLPRSFFMTFEVLGVLNLTNMHISSLPFSLLNIRSLKKLCLHFCTLEDTSMIGEMKNLQVLSLANSKIDQLSKQIAQLTALQILDMTNCQALEVIPSNVLSCLTKLEELCLGNSFNQWGIGGSNHPQKNATLDELKHLKNLLRLDIHIKDVKMLPHGLFSGKLRTFKIFIGDMWDWSGYEVSRTLKLILNPSIQLEDVGIKALLKRVEELHLHGQVGAKSILHELNGEGFPVMKHLRIQGENIFCQLTKFSSEI